MEKLQVCQVVTMRITLIMVIITNRYITHIIMLYI